MNTLTDILIPPKPIYHRAVQEYERRLLQTALDCDCTRVYVVDWTEQHECRLDFCYMCYPFQARREAFKLAKEKHTTVKIFNFRRWIDMPEDEFQCAFYPSPNKDIAVLIRERHRGHRPPPFRTM